MWGQTLHSPRNEMRHEGTSISGSVLGPNKKPALRLTRPLPLPVHRQPRPKRLAAPVNAVSDPDPTGLEQDRTVPGGTRAVQRTVFAILAAAQALTSPLLLEVLAPAPSQAVLNSPNARIPRTVDAALRRSIPAFNSDVRTVQTNLEEVAFKLRIPQRKPWDQMTASVSAASSIVNSPEKVMYGVPREREADAASLVDRISEGLRGVQGAIDARDPDKLSQRLSAVLQDVAALELIQAPGLPFIIPREYQDLPRLTGRALVEMTVERPDGSLSFVDNDGNGPQKKALLQIVLDGYSAPITAGNFADNVLSGVYDNTPLLVSYASVLAGGGVRPGSTIPLEILPAGEFDPQYRIPLEVASGELPVLPLSIYGAVAMARAPDSAADGLLAGDEFFVFKFTKEQAGLSGLSFDEGTFGVFGYVTKGIELVDQLRTGDIISKVRLVDGEARLLIPNGKP